MKSTPSAFVDTNILVYAAEERTPVARKTVIARELLLLPRLFLSVQVLNEFVVTARNPGKLGLSREKEDEWLNEWLHIPVTTLTKATFFSALEIHYRHGISHWDSLIVASALEAGCQTIYSEDLNHGQEYDGVKVINPFR
jgi:predicted nucleic acid-binding protein